MKKKISFSIIITTYNRSKNLFEIIKCIQKQVCVEKNYEIIICDSNSRDSLKVKNYIKQFLNLNIFYFNCKINHQAYKRNFGAKQSSGKYIIFIDDDCFPDTNFLQNYYLNMKREKTSTIYCGIVKYIQLAKNNYLIKYRDSRLIQLKDQNSKNIPEKNFISMNMCISKKILLNNKFLFNENFRFYGFEDFELAYRFKQNKYNIKLVNALVFHKDQRSFDIFLKKYHALGEYGITDIVRINKNAAKKSIFYKIENNLFIILLIHLPFISIILEFFEKLIIKIDRNIFFYFSALYKASILNAFLIGLKKRKKKPSQDIGLIKNNNWYN